MAQNRTPKKFSNELEAWLKGPQPKNFDTLIQLSEDKSFAVLFLILMILPALPLPTGGVTHVLEIITMLVALELIIGLKRIWLPEWARNLKLGKFLEGRAIPELLKRVRQVEKHSSPRWRWIFGVPLTPRIIGLFVFAMALTAFLAPPFSGLDTFPSLCVVIISLAVILDDAVLLLVGGIFSILSVVLVIALGDAAVRFVHHIF